MTDLRIYDEKMSFLGIIDTYFSLLWTRKYSDVGSFELHTPITTATSRLLRPGNLVWVKGAKEAGIIENIFYEATDRKSEIKIKGRFLEALLDRRILKTTFSFKGKAAAAIKGMIESCTPILSLETNIDPNLGPEVAFQCTYKTLLFQIKKLLKISGLGMRILPDFRQKKMILELYEGVDLSTAQSERNRVIFSESYGNLDGSSYTFSVQNTKNFALVAGEGEGAARVTVIVDQSQGGDLREMFVDASDLRKEELSEEAYRSLLVQRGREVLLKNATIESVECSVSPRGNFDYKTHYDLGDIVTVKKESWNLEQHLRITEIQEIYEQEEVIIAPVLGNPLPETLDLND